LFQVRFVPGLGAVQASILR